jgi:hypothetical protein
MTGYDFRVWSASLPIDVAEDGRLIADPGVRPWNGRRLTPEEIAGCLAAAADGPQAAYEWLSEHAL